MLNTNTLMTGDIVYNVATDTPFRVTGIRDSYYVAGIALDNTHRSMVADRDDLTGIQLIDVLTPMNGWKDMPGNWKIINFDNPRIRIGWNSETADLVIGYGQFPISVIYLHHLQNILRCAGLGEYANNIKLPYQE